MQSFALHLTAYHVLHLTQRFKRTVIQIAAIHKRAQAPQRLFTRCHVTRHRARLDERVAFPLAAVGLIILFKRIKAHRQRATLTIRSQAHIHAKHKTLGCNIAQGIDQALPQACEIFLITEMTRAVGLAIFGVSENQVNVG